MHNTIPILVAMLASATAFAQQPSYLFTVQQNETTLLGSGGTVLSQLKPNEIHYVEFDPANCPGTTAEKWAPRSCLLTMGGEADGDDVYWDAGVYDKIDALLVGRSSSPVAAANQHTVFYSPRQALLTCVGGSPDLLPGDVGRVIDGQVDYFIEAARINESLGLPAGTPINVDAIAASPQFGVFFSLENDWLVSPVCGSTLLRDGAIAMIPTGAITWSGTGTVSAVLPGSALVIYTESDVDAMVVNAGVTDRNNVCQSQIVDTDALDIDWFGPPPFSFPSCTGIVATVPSLIFAGESLTGAGVLNTRSGGQIHPGPCGLLATPCGTGPTLGDQMGLDPVTVGSLNGLAATRVCQFVIEPVSPSVAFGAPFQVDIHSPGATTFLFMGIAPAGPCQAPASVPWWFGGLCFPNYYPAILFPGFVGSKNTSSGFASYDSLLDFGFTAPTFPIDTIWQAVTIVGGNVEFSTPLIIEVP